MTFREKLMQEYPDRVSNEFTGGCCFCPESYGFEEPFSCSKIGSNCQVCWDREIPEEQTTEESKGENKMKSIECMVEDYLVNNITSDDIENAVANILDTTSIEDYLFENDVLRDAIYSAVNKKINACIEMYL